MNNFPHVIRANKNNRCPNSWIFFDVETIPVRISSTLTKQTFRLGVACYYSPKRLKKPQWLKFTDINEFWKWVFSKIYKKDKLCLIAHNTSFDFRMLEGFREFSRRGWAQKFIVIDSPPFILRYKKFDKTIEIIDTLNYFKTSVEQLGKLVKLPKLKMPLFEDSNEMWFTYCQRDVEIIYELWKYYLEFYRRYNMGNFARTVAGQSYNLYRHRFMKYKLHVHSFADVTEIERSGYFGGRTECFYIGEIHNETVYKLDVNSLYPYVMLNNYYPTEFHSKRRGISLDELKDIMNVYCVLSEVKLNTNKPVYPKVISGKLCFPVGEFWTTLPTPELKEALIREDIVKIGTIAIYKRAKIFTEFVKELYNLRLKLRAEGNEVFSTFVKILMNSLYGKFGQRNDIWEFLEIDNSRVDGYTEGINLDTGERFIERVITGFVYKHIGKEEWKHAIPSISAHVTSYARMLLWDYMTVCGENNYYYCDTDSLFTNQEGYEGLQSVISDKELGMLKLEDTANYLEIRNLKDYTFGNENHKKGLKSTAVQVAPDIYRTEVFEGIKGALRNNRLNSVYVRDVNKHYTRDYSKGIVNENGYVEPFWIKTEDYEEYQLNKKR